MSWHCSLALVEEFSRLGFSDGEQSVLLRSIRTAEKSYFGAKKKGISSRSQSGTMCDPSMGNSGVESWTSYLLASRASRSVSRASAQGETTSAISGPRPSGLFARWSPDSRSWRTYQGFSIQYKTKKQARLKQATSGRFLGTWPRAGMTRGGVCFRLLNWERRIEGIGYGWSVQESHLQSTRASMGKGLYQPLHRVQNAPQNMPEVRQERIPGAIYPTPGVADSWGGTLTNAGGNVKKWNGVNSLKGMANHRLWPTPTQRDHKDGTNVKNVSVNALLGRAVCPTKTRGSLNPVFVEYLMGWPVGWTALEPLETDRFQQWLGQHGSY